MYLFDTDFIVELLRGRLPPTVTERLQALPPERQRISAITLSELVYGARRSAQPEHHLRMIEAVLLPCVRVVAFDAGAAYMAGTLRDQLERKGTPLPFPDLQIAAMAIANDLCLITGNTRHFARVPGLRTENWAAAMKSPRTHEHS